MPRQPANTSKLAPGEVAEFVNALRSVLGLQPIYRNPAAQPSPTEQLRRHFLNQYFRDGNRQIQPKLHSL